MRTASWPAPSRGPPMPRVLTEAGLCVQHLHSSRRRHDRYENRSNRCDRSGAPCRQRGAEVTLRAPAASQLRPLDAEVVRRYLCDDAAGPVAMARCTPVLAVLGTGGPAGQALRAPLMVGLARAIYNPRPGELTRTVREPAELCGFTDRAAVEAHLFDEFVPATYRTLAESRWTAGQAETWLKFLARHLEQTIGGPDPAWWQLLLKTIRALTRPRGSNPTPSACTKPGPGE